MLMQNLGWQTKSIMVCYGISGVVNRIRWSVTNSHKPSPSLSTCEGVKNSLGFWIPRLDSGIQVLKRSLSVELGF